jgi:hypothetical protein
LCGPFCPASTMKSVAAAALIAAVDAAPEFTLWFGNK